MTMGKVTDSLLKGLSGKIGGLVFYQLNGETYVRKAPGKQSKAVKGRTSELKQISQDVIRQTHQFLKFFTPLLEFGYQEWGRGGRKPYHAAVSYTIKHSFSFVGNTAWKKLDLSLLKFSRGSLLGPENPIVERVSHGVRFSWQDNSNQAGSKPTDASFLVLVHPDQERSRYCLLGETRSKGAHVLPLSEMDLNESWHVYLAFSQENPWTRSRVFSDMKYLGVI